METWGQNSRKTGELMVEEGLVNPADIEQVLAIQEKNRTSLSRNQSRFFGMILCGLNLITPTDNYCVLKKHNKLIGLQDFLIQKKILSRPVVEKTQTRSMELNIPFISLLLEERLIPKTLLAQLVFDLFYIPFRSISDVVFDADSRPGLSLVIKKVQAREHKVIPLVLKENTLVCGITDPENLVFIREVNHQFPQYRFKPLIIPFSGFIWFYKMLYEETWNPGRVTDKSVDLSLLLKFSVSIFDPEGQKEEILSLYKRYELVRSLAGSPVKKDRARMFQAFVAEHHEKLTREYRCSTIVFSLKNEGTQVRIMAFPNGRKG